MKIIGIYQILNVKNQKKYIGKTSRGRKRWNEHKCRLRSNSHNNPYLQRSWNKYGEEFFEFSIFKECQLEELNYWEEHYIDLYKSYKKENGYNMKQISDGLECHSEETKQKLREINLGKKLSKETKQRISESKKGQVSWNKGISPSKETIEKFSRSRKGKCCGEKNPSAKLSWEQIKEIRLKYIPFIYGFQKLAKEFGVAKVTIKRIIKGETWVTY